MTGWNAMPGDDQYSDGWYILDNSTISEIFRSYYQDQFPSFWERFNELVRASRVVSVRAVQIELEDARRPEIVNSVGYLRDLNQGFFSDPDEQEQSLVREMLNDPSLSAANNRWREKANRGTEDADPYLIAKARVQNQSLTAATVVTQEQVDNPSNIPAVCQRFGVRCINLRQMMSDLGWRF